MMEVGIKAALRTLILTLCALTALAGCQWDPPHDNPLDPDAPNSRLVGSLAIRVLTLNLQPIANATVIVSRSDSLAYSGATDSSGAILFGDLASGKWWVWAFRDEIAGPIYARDSVQVTIEAGLRGDTSLMLDALPVITGTVAFSTNEVDSVGVNHYTLRFRAQADDPDGLPDLAFITWRLEDLLQDTMQYQSDSSYWASDLPDTLYPGRIDDALGLSFYFSATDRAGVTARSLPVHILRIIHEIPFNLRHDLTAQPVVSISWNFSGEEFSRDTTQYNFLLRVYDISVGRTLIYETRVPASAQNRIDYTLPNELLLGKYSWEVYVIDRFANSSLSAPDFFEITVP